MRRLIRAALIAGAGLGLLAGAVGGYRPAAEPPGAAHTYPALVVASQPNPYASSAHFPEQRALLGPFVRLLRAIYRALPEETRERLASDTSGLLAQVNWEQLTGEQRQQWVDIVVAYNRWEEPSATLWHWDFDGVAEGEVRFQYAYRDESTGHAMLAASYEVDIWDSKRGEPAGELRHPGLLFDSQDGILVAPQPSSGDLPETGQEAYRVTLHFLREIYWGIPADQRRAFEVGAPAAVLTVYWEDLTPEQTQRWVNLQYAVFELARRDPIQSAAGGPGTWFPSGFPGVMAGSFRFGWSGEEPVLPHMCVREWMVTPDPVTGLPGRGLGGSGPFEPGPYS